MSLPPDIGQRVQAEIDRFLFHAFCGDVHGFGRHMAEWAWTEATEKARVDYEALREELAAVKAEVDELKGRRNENVGK